MKKIRSQNGITLIALIITIIVLLILAVVTIGAVRESDIMEYAKNSADRYNTEKDKEESMLGTYEDEIAKYSNTEVKEDTDEKGIEYFIYADRNDNGDYDLSSCIIQRFNYNNILCTTYGTENGRNVC